MAYSIIYLVAGLGIRLDWYHLSAVFLCIGIVLYIISAVFFIWSIMENKHFEATSRIQGDRNQTVITTGPYRLIRHPGYFSIIVWTMSVPMIFGTLNIGIVSFAIIIIITIRTYFEDSMLKKELPGYLDYTNQVKYRLIPFIW